jgi:anaphase-promoting complex subunit 10
MEIRGQIELSSYKPGFGKEELLSKNLDLYWQSDGAQPHFINFRFPKKQRIYKLKIYCDYRVDEV